LIEILLRPWKDATAYRNPSEQLTYTSYKVLPCPVTVIAKIDPFVVVFLTTGAGLLLVGIGSLAELWTIGVSSLWIEMSGAA
jgi:hypothetical protein